jgi:hypothetical protein
LYVQEEHCILGRKLWLSILLNYQKAVTVRTNKSAVPAKIVVGTRFTPEPKIPFIHALLHMSFSDT